jgi:hypothetical protein
MCLRAKPPMLKLEKKKEVEKTMMFEEEKINMELHLADIVHRQKMKAYADKLKMKKIKNHICDMENRLHYALASFLNKPYE